MGSSTGWVQHRHRRGQGSSSLLGSRPRSQGRGPRNEVGFHSLASISVPTKWFLFFFLTFQSSTTRDNLVVSNTSLNLTTRSWCWKGARWNCQDRRLIGRKQNLIKGPSRPSPRPYLLQCVLLKNHWGVWFWRSWFQIINTSSSLLLTVDSNWVISLLFCCRDHCGLEFTGCSRDRKAITLVNCLSFHMSLKFS